MKNPQQFQAGDLVTAYIRDDDFRMQVAILIIAVKNDRLQYLHVKSQRLANQYFGISKLYCDVKIQHFQTWMQLKTTLNVEIMHP